MYKKFICVNKKKNIFLKFIYIIIFIILEFILDYINITNNYNNKNIKKKDFFISNNTLIKNKSIYNQYKFDSLEISFNKSKSFIDKSMKGILLNDKKNFISSQKPKVSVIIPMYNCQNFIYRAIKSVQNQDIFDLEIILINDFSSDNTSEVISQIQKEDPRIKINIIF